MISHAQLVACSVFFCCVCDNSCALCFTGYLSFESADTTAQRLEHAAAPALIYPYSIDTKYYSASLSLRCAGEDHRDMSAVLDSLLTRSADAVPAFGCDHIDELADQCDAICMTATDVAVL